jgi:hypothetical protein
MTRNEPIEPVSFTGLVSTTTTWLAGILIMLCVSLPVSAKDGAHPYERWAEEFGMDLNASYDGIRIMEFQGGQFEASERRAPGKMYSEIHMSNMTTGIILREDLQKSYILMPSMGFYKEDSLKGGMMQSANGMEFSKIEKVGREEIIGHPSTKFKTKFKDNEGKGAGFIWVTDTGVPIKMDMIYSNKKFKGERISMVFTELNLREQDPAFFELPANLKPMGMSSIGDLMKMGAGAPAAGSAESAPTTSAPAASGNGDLATRQQACIEDAAKSAEQASSAKKKTKGFGRLLGKMSRTANRLGISNKLGGASRDIYDANATANDVADIANELGISENDVDRCRDPS